MRLIFAILTAALAVPAMAQTKSPVPLAASGKWGIEYHKAMCVLSRGFGVGDDKVTLAFRPWTLNDSVEVILVSKRGGYGRGSATVSLPGTAIKETVPFIGVRSPKLERRFDTMVVKRSTLEALPQGQGIAIKAGSGSSIILAPGGIAPALKALKSCEDDLIRSWGVEVGALPGAAIGWTAVGNPAEWITTDDYPLEAINSRFEGTSAILWMISTDGRVRGCRVVGSSGHDILDQAACAAITSRAKYKPALDAKGQPIPSYQSRRVVWSLP